MLNEMKSRILTGKNLLFLLAITLFVSALTANPIEKVNEWIENQTDNFKTNDVVKFLNGSRGESDIAYGNEYVFNGNQALYSSAITLDSSCFVLVYSDKGNSYAGTAIIGTVSGREISYGAEFVFHSGNTFAFSATALDATHFVVAFQDRENSNFGTAIIGTVSGNTISYSSEFVFRYSSVDFIAIATLDATHVVVIYRDHLVSDFGVSVVGTISGSSILFGSHNVYYPDYSGAASVLALDTTHFVIAYLSGYPPSTHGAVILGTVLGSTISYGGEYEFNSSYVSRISGIRLDATRFVVAYTEHWGSEPYGTAIVGSVLGSSFSFGSEYVFNSQNTQYLSATTLDLTHFIVTYVDFGNDWPEPDREDGTAIVGTVTDNTISFGPEYIFNSAFTSSCAALSLESSYFVVAYNDEGNSDNGTAIVGERDGQPILDGDVLISEISDNKTGFDEGTGFIELWNDTGYPFSLDGYSIVQGTNPNGTGFIPGVYSYPIPAGYTIPDGGFFIISNGAGLSTFSNAWSSALSGTAFDAGNSNLDIANGFAYALSDGARANQDESLEVNTGERIHQESGGSWPQDTPEDATPGELGGDDPLPVTLSSFTAVQTTDNFARLNWITQSESSLIGYNIYRNVNEIQSFMQINPAIIAGTNSSEEQHYTFTDPDVEYEQTYHYWLESIGVDYQTELFGPVTLFIESPIIIELPNASILRSAYPNPFNPTTTIEFDIKENEKGTIIIYNVKGRVILKETFGPGNHTFEWNADKYSSGVYFYKLQTNSYSKINKMLMLK
ncbi:MAG: hypothetical protein DRI23_02110 [Candidatus Cloacimonadota bacterium]|nr:MAG: hypothetical protein DRI23_02110 [Candidatus Cloacimonadota bacterium]